MPYFNIFDPNIGVYEFELTKDRMVIGRKRALCDCVINDSTVSREHAEVVKLNNGKYLIRDMDSSSGVIINGYSEKEFRLTEGLNIQLGQIVLEYRDGIPEKKYKIRHTDLTVEQLQDQCLFLPTSLEVYGRFIGVDAGAIFHTGDTIDFGKDGVKLIVPELLLGEYSVLELKIKWPGGQVRSFFTEVIGYFRPDRCVYLKFHKISKNAYDRILEESECLDWILLQIPKG